MGKSFPRIILTSIILVLITVFLILLQFNVMIGRTIINPSFYDDFFSDLQVYEQARQLILQRIMTELPFGREGLKYFEKVLTDEWLRQEFIVITNEFFDFLNSNTDDLPKLRIYKFKEAVTQHMVNYGDVTQRIEILDFWLGPIPDIVRLQHIVSTAFLHDLKNAISLFESIFRIALLILVSLLLLLLAVNRSVKDTILLFGAALFSSGLVTLGIIFIASWILKYSIALQDTKTSIISFGFPYNFVQSFFNSLIYSFATLQFTISLLFAVIGFLMICFVPLKSD